jgi:hypothetical protein
VDGQPPPDPGVHLEENLFGSGSSFVPLEFLALKIDSVLMSVEEKVAVMIRPTLDGY